MATNTPSSPPHSSKRPSLAGLVESTIPLSFVSSHSDNKSSPRDNEMSSNNSNKKISGPASTREGLSTSVGVRRLNREPPLRVFSQPSKIDEQVLVITTKGERTSRPSSLTVDQPLLMSPRSDRSPSEVVRVLRDSVFDSDSDSPSLPCQQMQPRQPTGAEFNPKSRSPIGSETDIVSFHEVLKQLDKEEANRARRTLLIEHWSQLSQPVVWEDTAQCGSHLWVEREGREACYLHETQFCRDQKTLHQKRSKVRCSSCRVLVHTTCIRQLYYGGIVCKPSFREIKKKVKDITVNHHFLQRRKMAGKCAACKRGFGVWKSHSGRTFEGVSCSWCGDSYHLGCFMERLKDEPCHLGPLRNMIIPPSWIIKLPRIEPDPPAVVGAGSMEKKKKKSTRRKTRRNNSTSDDKSNKSFTVKALSSSHNKPVIIFINPKSGGNQGSKILQTFQWLLNPRQVFDLSVRGPEFGLQMFRNCPNFRILACGGDGTVGWVLSVLDRLEIKPLPPVAVLPLGTGNDLSRVLDWGGSYGDEPLENILMHVEDGPVVELDRWMLSVWRNEEVSYEEWKRMEGKDDVPLHVINNYFSIGADAQVTLDFHEGREANPQKYNNRFINKYTYSKLSGADLVQRKFANLTDHIRLVGDGIDITHIIRQQRLEAICFLNITSYGSGCNPWGSPVAVTGQKIGPQSISDGMIEVVGFWASTFPKLLLGAHGERLAHCQHVKLYTYTSLPVQIDGEACKLKPSIIEVVFQNRALMIKKAPLRLSSAPLRGVGNSHQLKVSVAKVTLKQYESLHSDLSAIRKEASDLGLVVTTPGESLKKLRPQINRFTQPKEYDQKPLLMKNWQYLDVASTTRFDRMFQVLPEQEESILVGDMLCDGILLVEYEDTAFNTSLEESPESNLDGRGTKSTSLERNTYNPNVMLDVEDELSASVEIGKQQTTGTIQDKSSPIKSIVKNPSTASVNATNSDSGSGNGDGASPRVGSGLSPLPILDLSSDSMSDNDSSGQLADIQKALFDAVKRGNVGKLKELHSKGARLAHVDGNGFSPLHHAARLGRKEVVKYIVDNIPREALDLQDEDKAQTALHKAAWYGYRGICKILVEAGASLLRTDYQGNTPYYKSIESEDVKLQEYLRKKEILEKGDYDLEEAAV